MTTSEGMRRAWDAAKLRQSEASFQIRLTRMAMPLTGPIAGSSCCLASSNAVVAVAGSPSWHKTAMAVQRCAAKGPLMGDRLSDLEDQQETLRARQGETPPSTVHPHPRLTDIYAEKFQEFEKALNDLPVIVGYQAASCRNSFSTTAWLSLKSWHPNLAYLYRRKVEQLQEDLQHPEIRDEAI